MRQDEMLKEMDILLIMNDGKTFEYLDYKYKIKNGKLYWHSEIFNSWYIDDLCYWEYGNLRDVMNFLMED
jgi:hypothetical protein